MKLKDILSEFTMNRYMNRYHFYGDMGAVHSAWNQKHVEYPPNYSESFELKLLKRLLYNKKGIEPDKQWNYKERNRIKNLVQSGYIIFDEDRYFLTEEGETYLKALFNVAKKGIHMPVFANVYSMYKVGSG